MSGESPRQGMLDTNIVILRRWIDPAELPDEMAISAVTLAELSAGPLEVRRNDEQDEYDEHEERARRLETLQRTESEFDPVPFDTEAARAFGRLSAAVVAAGRKPRRRIADLMIAATAVAEDLPLFTTNPGDYLGLEKLVRIVSVSRPSLPHERRGALCCETAPSSLFPPEKRASALRAARHPLSSERAAEYCGSRASPEDCDPCHARAGAVARSIGANPS